MYGNNIEGLDETTTSTMHAILADKLIADEIARQDRMWGLSNERAAVDKGQLLRAAFAQLDLLGLKRDGYDDATALSIAADNYPEGWTGFRDYGSKVANLVVAAAFLRQEIKRCIANGERTFRSSRDLAKQPYTGAQPAVIEP